MTSTVSPGTQRASSTDESEWLRCPSCGRHHFARHFRRDLSVCGSCGWHARLTAPERIAALLDPGTASPLPATPGTHDPLGFVDLRAYPDRLDEARAHTGLTEAVVCVRGELDGMALVVAAMDFRFLGGSLGTGVGELITRAAETALAEHVPLLLVTASGGARMQEGVLSLMQMAKTSQALAQLDEAGITTITLVTDPTYAGVAASFATLSDVIVAEPGARLGFAGPRVIEQTIREKLPDGFQTAEFLLERGLIDVVAPRPALRRTLANLLVMHYGGTLPEPMEPADADGALIRDPALLPERDPWETVRLARHAGRPTTLDYVAHLIEGFTELRGDRMTGDCPAVVAGPGRFGDVPVMVIGLQKGRTTGEQVERNFGMAMPSGYRKAARLMRLAAKHHLPVVALIDTPGAHPGVDAEIRGQAPAIAENLRLMSRLPVPVVAVVTGEGGSGGALALGVADRVLVGANGIYSVISPEGCAAILWRNPEAAPQAAAALQLDARQLLGQGIVDAVVPEPEGGSHIDPVLAADLLRTALHAVLGDLLSRDGAALVRERRERFRRYGADSVPQEVSA